MHYSRWHLKFLLTFGFWLKSNKLQQQQPNKKKKETDENVDFILCVLIT